MIRLKPPIIRRVLFASVAAVFLGLSLVTSSLFFMPRPASVMAAVNDCSDVYTPLESYVVDGVNANKTAYTKAMNASGVPWEMLAAIHYRETNFSHTEPGNGQGIFQDNYAVAAPGTKLSDSQFYQELLHVATIIQTDYVFRNSPNPATNVTLRKLQPNEQSINLVKNTLYSYNGRATVYANQAAQYGYDSSTVPYEGSPYVMNRFDCPRARMGIITQDYGSIDGTDTRYGAFTVYARLHGDSYWLAMTVPYSWIINSQEIYNDPNRTVITNTKILAANTTYYLRVTARNFGNTTWTNSGSNPIRLGTANPKDRTSAFCDSSWLSCKRPAQLEEASVAPGEIGTFEFTIKTPKSYNTYKEYFNLLAEGKTWMNDPGMYYALTVQPPTYQWDQSSLDLNIFADSGRTQKVSINALAPGQTYYVNVSLLNSGNTTWTNSGSHPTKLGTDNPRNRTSIFCDSSWLSCKRPAQLEEASVAPGNTGTFQFSITAPTNTGEYNESFNLVSEGLTWMQPSDGTSIGFPVYVVTPAPLQNTTYQMNPGDTLAAGQTLLSQDGHSVLAFQRDGNVVLNKDYKPTWSTSTANLNAAKLVMQTDGNLVVYDKNNHPLWDSNTNNNSNAYLQLQPDGNLVIYSSSGSVLWSSHTWTYPSGQFYTLRQLEPGDLLYKGQSLETADRRYKLSLQQDGNLVLYYSPKNRPLWASSTKGTTISYAGLRSDGELVIIDTAGKVVWTTSQVGANPHLALQFDGNAVIYSTSGVLWKTATAVKARFAPFEAALDVGGTLERGDGLASPDLNYAFVVGQDGNLVVYDKALQPLWNSHTYGKDGTTLRMQQDGNLVLYTAGGKAVWYTGTSQ